MKHIRNFAIISHIDHGKSTLADRILEVCQAIPTNHQPQLLDSLELEREHGITIKLKAVRLNYILNAIPYTLNLIDTPGHADFSYEVSRSLASVEGAILIVDATQGIQAQTLANFNLAISASLTIIPVVNKIDLPNADIKGTIEELKTLGFLDDEIVKVSAKTGDGVIYLIEKIIEKVPTPNTTENKLQALIFDSSLDPYKGVVATVRIFAGSVCKDDQIFLIGQKKSCEVLELGYLTPKPVFIQQLNVGEVGFIITNLKELSHVSVGDTLTLLNDLAPALAGYKLVKPVVFLSFYPINPNDFQKLVIGLEKLRLNDSSLSYSLESSTSLGQGVRIGFLGLLHAQITQERLEREYDLEIIAASPSVSFEIDNKIINKPQDFDPYSKDVKESYASVSIFTPSKFYGPISNLIHAKRGQILNFENIGSLQKIEAEMPLLEIMVGFYDKLKTISSGFASFDFEVSDYRPAKLSRLDVLINHKIVEGLSQIVPEQNIETTARTIVEKLKQLIPKQQIPIPIQATIGTPSTGSGHGKIIARETIPAFRKDVTAKLYGGDVTRKMKLLEKQKKGKKRMKKFGNIDIPQEAFLAILKI